jgi:hypothetical protein
MTAAQWKEYNQQPTRQIKRVEYHNKKRNLGNHFLNEYFAGSEAHHINSIDVAFIPKSMHEDNKHNLITGDGMATINKLALNFIGQEA